MKLDNYKVKKKIMDIGKRTQCGHVASALSCVNILCDIYNARKDPIVILSKGHGALAQYVILNMLGKLPDDVLDTYYQDGGLCEHPSVHPEWGVYASTGSLGHGLAIGIGWALSDKNREVYVVMSDGELDEGSTWEALRIIGKLEIKNIFPIVDVNGVDAMSETKVEYPMMYRPYYGVKGEGWGKLENTVESHYTKVTKEIYNTWKKNIKGIEKRRLNNIKEYKKNAKQRGDSK